jgi:hypothetical protein
MHNWTITREALGAARLALQARIAHHDRAADAAGRDATTGLLAPELRRRSQAQCEAHTEFARELRHADRALARLAQLVTGKPAVVTITEAAPVRGGFLVCPRCDGRGRALYQTGHTGSRANVVTTCKDCNGKGVFNG